MNNSQGEHSANLETLLQTKDMLDDDFECQYLDVGDIPVTRVSYNRRGGWVDLIL